MAANDAPVFYYDLGSPYACLAASRIERVLPVAPVWQPVWAAAVVVASGREWRRPADERLARADDVARRAFEYGLPPWRWPPSFAYGDVAAGEEWEPTNTLQLMRLATSPTRAASARSSPAVRSSSHSSKGERSAASTTR